MILSPHLVLKIYIIYVWIFQFDQSTILVRWLFYSTLVGWTIFLLSIDSLKFNRRQSWYMKGPNRMLPRVATIGNPHVAAGSRALRSQTLASQKSSQEVA